MNTQHFLLRDVAHRLGVKPYQITYAITVGLVPEPGLRISNKRIFLPEDVERLAKHFNIVMPNPRGKEKHGQ
jgi:DNA-binding transcriptional MerR regulator